MNEELKIEENKRLIERYPFLKPQKVFCDEPEEDYDYTYTYLDEMPRGWRITFGKRMCEEIREELVKWNYLNDYHILQIKEKYGMLCWYDNGFPKESKVDEIINKYEDISENTCITCGNPATKLSRGWVCPYCDKCFDEYYPNQKYDKL